VQNGGQSSKQEIRLVDDQQEHTIRISLGREDSKSISDTSSTPEIVV
jgi:hypothetical protein